MFSDSLFMCPIASEKQNKMTTTVLSDLFVHSLLLRTAGSAPQSRARPRKYMGESSGLFFRILAKIAATNGWIRTDPAEMRKHIDLKGKKCF
jgi:hypothetical protein